MMRSTPQAFPQVSPLVLVGGGRRPSIKVDRRSKRVSQPKVFDTREVPFQNHPALRIVGGTDCPADFIVCSAEERCCG